MNYPQQLIFSHANSGKLQAACFAEIALYNPRRHIVGNYFDVCSEGQIGGVGYRYHEKYARIAALSTFTLDKLTEGMAWLATGMSRKQALEKLADAYSRVVRGDVGLETFCFITFETVDVVQAETQITPTPEAKATASGVQKELLETR